MDKSAIQQIQEYAIQGMLNEQIESAETNTPLFVAPGSFELTSLEKYMEHRSGYRFTFNTESINDFIQYGKDFDQVGSICFVDSAKMSSRTIFDLGTLEVPLHQNHKALLQLHKTAAFLSLLDVNGTRMSQKYASDFIEDWADNIIIHSKEGDYMSTKSAAASLRNLTIETAREVNSKVDDYSESMSAMEKVEAKDQHLLPSEIKFRCTPYLHLEERDFIIRISLLTGDESPKLSFRIIKLESIKEEIAEEFKEILVAGLGDQETKVYMGS